MLEKPESKDTKATNVTSYIPGQLPNFEFQEGKDIEDAENILKQLEDVPELTNQQKKEMAIRCKDKVEDVNHYLATLKSQAVSETNKEDAIQMLKNICDINIKIEIRINRQTQNLSIDELWGKIRNNEIDLKDYSISGITYNEGEFIKHEILKPGETQIYYTRNIKKIKLIGVKDYKDVRIEGISDIKN